MLGGERITKVFEGRGNRARDDVPDYSELTGAAAGRAQGISAAGWQDDKGPHLVRDLLGHRHVTTTQIYDKRHRSTAESANRFLAV